MSSQDLLITPIYILLFTFIAFIIRPFVTSISNRKYFLPALWLKFFGAISLGIIYSFYYSGGDTFNFWNHGSKWIWEALLSQPSKGISLLFDEGGLHNTNTFEYSSKIWFYSQPSSYMIVRIAAFFDIFTYHTYSSTSLFFSVFSFSGSWAFLHALSKLYQPNKWLALSILFVPSVIFWGSGILKDTITLGALGWLTHSLIHLIELRFGH